MFDKILNTPVNRFMHEPINSVNLQNLQTYKLIIIHVNTFGFDIYSAKLHVRYITIAYYRNMPHLSHFKFISKSSYTLGYFKLATVKIFHQKTVTVRSILKIHYSDIILLN